VFSGHFRQIGGTKLLTPFVLEVDDDAMDPHLTTIHPKKMS